VCSEPVGIREGKDAKEDSVYKGGTEKVGNKSVEINK
jgi:hypothetical protein